LVLGNIVRGVPLGPDGRFILPLFTDFGVRGEVGILDWYTISFGAFLFTCLAVHGASFLALRTAGAVNIRAKSIAKLLWWAVLSSIPVMTVMTWYVRPELFQGIASRPLAWAFVIATLLGAWTIIAGVQGKVKAKTFLGGCVFLLGFMGSAAIGVFPVFLKSTLGEGNSILVFDGGASEYGLKIGLLWLSR
jgi:cytochrome d ubiquinol oxidase subunit II